MTVHEIVLVLLTILVFGLVIFGINMIIGGVVYNRCNKKDCKGSTTDKNLTAFAIMWLVEFVALVITCSILWLTR